MTGVPAEGRACAASTSQGGEDKAGRAGRMTAHTSPARHLLPLPPPLPEVKQCSLPKYECKGSWSILQMAKLRLREAGGRWLKLLPCISLLLVSSPIGREALSCPTMGSVILRTPRLQDQPVGCLPTKKTHRLFRPFPSPLISLTSSLFPLKLQGENCLEDLTVTEYQLVYNEGNL